jgi:hypothetical protein
MKLLRRASAKSLGRLAPLNFLRCYIPIGAMYPEGRQKSGLQCHSVRSVAEKFSGKHGNRGMAQIIFLEDSYVRRARQNSSICSSVRPFVSGTRK